MMTVFEPGLYPQAGWNTPFRSHSEIYDISGHNAVEMYRRCSAVRANIEAADKDPPDQRAKLHDECLFLSGCQAEHLFREKRIKCVPRNNVDRSAGGRFSAQYADTFVLYRDGCFASAL